MLNYLRGELGERRRVEGPRASRLAMNEGVQDEGENEGQHEGGDCEERPYIVHSCNSKEMRDETSMGEEGERMSVRLGKELSYP